METSSTTSPEKKWYEHNALKSGIALMAILFGVALCTNQQQPIQIIHVDKSDQIATAPKVEPSDDIIIKKNHDTIVIEPAAPVTPIPEVAIETTPSAPTIDPIVAQQKLFYINKIIANHSDVNLDTATLIVEAAYKHQTNNFDVKDILALIEVSSAFKVNAVGHTRVDPPKGLTQVRTGIWKDLIGDQDMTQIDTQIKVAVDILEKYQTKTKNKQGTISAYSTGITAYMADGAINVNYLDKFEHAKVMYS